MGDLLYLTPTTIIPSAKTIAATVISVETATNDDGIPVWRLTVEPNTALTADDRIVVEYARRVGKPCPVKMGESMRVPVAPVV